MLPAGLYEPGYLRALGLGEDVRVIKDGRLSVVVRSIPGSTVKDAVLPWPYSMINGEEDLDLIVDHCSDLASVVGVTLSNPNHIGLPTNIWFRRHRDQYVFDPSLNRTPWSAKTRSHVRRGNRSWDVTEVTGRTDAARIIREVTREIVRRHHSQGTWLDFGDDHFRSLETTPGFRTWAALGPAGELGAMCTAAVDADSVCMIHCGATDVGLHREAMYSLMPHMQTLCQETGRSLYLGNAQSTATGLQRFKARWTNYLRPAWTVGIVTNPALYDQLPGADDADFFPRYRQRWR